MGHIFISYSHKDADYAHGLAGNLQSMGFEVWIDARLDYGSQWPHEIQKQLDGCDVFILIMSPRSFASDWVQSELQRAKRKLKPIFPLLLEGDEPWLSIESTQYYDVRGGSFPDQKFYSAIKRVVSVDASRQTFQNPNSSLKKVATVNRAASRPKNTTAIVVGVVGLLALVLGVCVVVIVGGRFLVPLWTEPTSIPTTIPTSVPTTIPTELLTLNEFPTSQPTLTLVPTLTQTPIPPTGIPPTLTFTIIPPTAAPVVISNTYSIAQYGGEPNTQRSAPLDYTTTVQTVDLLEISISIPSGSSGLFFHIYLDNAEIDVTESLGSISNKYTTGFIDLSPNISRGVYKLTISPEGISGSGNLGYLSAWGGTLIIRTNVYP